MKTSLYILLCISALSLSPLWAKDSDEKNISIKQRLKQVDLSLVIRQYEQVKMEEFKTELNILEPNHLLNEMEFKSTVDVDTKEKELMKLHVKRLKALHNKKRRLKSLANELRDKALSMGVELEKVALLNSRKNDLAR